ncbi:MAG: YdcF family protein, partial [Chroococcales cyanobacterium]
AAMGVPPSAILLEPYSLNTYQNAVEVRKLLEARNIEKRVLLVTSATHMPRSLRIFQRQGIDAIPAPTDFLVSQQELDELSESWQSVTLNILPDASRLQQTTQSLKEYIGTAIYRLRGWL